MRLISALLMVISCCQAVHWWKNINGVEPNTWKNARKKIIDLLWLAASHEDVDLEMAWDDLWSFQFNHLKNFIGFGKKVKNYIRQASYFNCLLTQEGRTAEQKTLCKNPIRLLFDFSLNVIQDLIRLRSQSTVNKVELKLLFEGWLFHPVLETEGLRTSVSVTSDKLPIFLFSLMKIEATGFEYKFIEEWRAREPDDLTWWETGKAFDKQIASYLHSEAKTLCDDGEVEVDAEVLEFCDGNILFEAMMKVNELKDKNKDEEGYKEKMSAVGTSVLLYFLTDKVKYKEQLDKVKEKSENLFYVLDKIARQIFRSFPPLHSAKMREIIHYLPSAFSFHGCSTQRSNAARLTSEQFLCAFKDPVEQLEQFFKTLDMEANLGPRRPIVRVIDRRYDYRRLMTSQQNAYDRKLGDVRWLQTRTDALKHLTKFRSYFTEISQFSQARAESVSAFVEGRIKLFGERSKVLTNNINKGVKHIITSAYEKTKHEVAMKTAILAAKVLEGSNPFKFFMEFGSVSDILAATGDLDAAIVDLKQAQALFGLLDRVSKETASLMTGFVKDMKYVRNVRKLVKYYRDEKRGTFAWGKRVFLNKYDKFTPVVTDTQLSRVCKQWIEIIELGCKIREGCTSPVCVEDTGDPTLCFNAFVDMEEMCELRLKIYQFQFELMEAMADFMQAKTNEHASKRLVQSFSQKDLLEDKTLVRIGNMGLLTYHVQVIRTAMKLCDVFEYRRAGVRPTVCNVPLNNVRATSSLIDARCTIEADNYKIPILNGEVFANDKLNLDALYKGETVFFQIPDEEWLVKNKWILNEFKGQYAFYIRGFEIFLPKKASNSEKHIVLSEVVSQNQLVKNGAVYVLTPRREYSYSYRDSKTGCYNEQRVFSNPYNRLLGKETKICLISGGINPSPDVLGWYSIFSKWRLRIIGYKEADKPDSLPEDFQIVAKVVMCKKKFSEMKKRS